MQGSSVDRRRSVRISEVAKDASSIISVIRAVVVLGVVMLATMMIGMAYLRVGIDVRDRSAHRKEEVGEQGEPPSG